MGVTVAPARAAEFRVAVAAGVLAADGAMGTMLGSKLGARAAFYSRCFDEMNLSLPALVRDVHQEFLRAGARILGTNTFGANRKRLAASGFSDKVRAINQAGVRIAREAARSIAPEAFVAGVAGPLGAPLEPLGLTTRSEARAVFREQIGALVESGIDLLVLETFQDVNELEEAVAAAREAAGPDLPLAAYLTVEEDATLLFGSAGLGGTSLRQVARRLEDLPIDVLGVNCSAGPSVVLDALEQLAAWTTKPLAAKPSAGLPSLIAGRTAYPCSPEYMADFAPRFAHAGARIVGGCCGTTPEHIRQIRRALDGASIDPSPRPISVLPNSPADEEPEPSKPAVSRSDLAARLSSGQFAAMVEMLAPRGSDPSVEIAVATEVKRSGIEFLAVRPARGRMSAVAACHLLQLQSAMETALIAPGFDRRYFDFESNLLGARALGIRNVACAVEAIGSTSIASHLRDGGLFTGVSLDPGAADPEQQLRWFELHLNSGAAFVVTEPVFDPDLLEEFLKRIEPYRLPVIAGIRPLTGLRDALFLMHERRTPVAAAYLERLRQARGSATEEAEGAIIARDMVEIAARMASGICLSATPANPRFPQPLVDAIAARR